LRNFGHQLIFLTNIYIFKSTIIYILRLQFDNMKIYYGHQNVKHNC